MAAGLFLVPTGVSSLKAWAERHAAEERRLVYEESLRTAREAKLAQARAVVNATLERLGNDKQFNGVYRRPGEGNTFECPENDPWGKSLRAVYGRHMVTETLVVRAAGEDGVYGSEDDVVVEGSAINGAGLGNAALEGVEHATRRATSGVITGVRDHLPEAPKWGWPSWGGKKADKTKEPEPKAK